MLLFWKIMKDKQEKAHKVYKFTNFDSFRKVKKKNQWMNKKKLFIYNCITLQKEKKKLQLFNLLIILAKIYVQIKLMFTFLLI